MSGTGLPIGVHKRGARLRAIVHVLASICIVATGNSLLTTVVSLRLSDPAIAPDVVQFLLTAFPQLSLWLPAHMN